MLDMFDGSERQICLLTKDAATPLRHIFDITATFARASTGPMGRVFARPPSKEYFSRIHARNIRRNAAAISFARFQEVPFCERRVEHMHARRRTSATVAIPGHRSGRRFKLADIRCFHEMTSPKDIIDAHYADAYYAAARAAISARSRPACPRAPPPAL